MVDFDGMVTPLALAFVLKRSYMATLLLQAGANLCTPCPLQYRGEEDRADLDVASWLVTWFQSHNDSTAVHDVQDLVNTVTLYGSTNDSKRVRALAVAATKTTTVPPYKRNSVHCTRRRSLLSTQRMSQQRGRRRKGGRPPKLHSQRGRKVSHAVLSSLDKVYNHRRVLQNTWDIELDCTPFAILPPVKVVLAGGKDEQKTSLTPCAREFEHNFGTIQNVANPQ